MWGDILSTVVGGVAKTLVDNGKNQGGGTVVQQVQKPEYSGFMMPINPPKAAGTTESKPAPIAGEGDAVEAWVQLLSKYKAM